MEAAPESHLRLLAGQALVRAGPGDEFLVASAGLVAVANAYVMLGLLTEPEAEAVLNAVGKALTARGLPGSRVSIRSGADGYWRLRSRGRDGLSWMPRAVAVSPVRLAAGSSDVRFEWLRLGRAGVRFQVRATAAGERLPPRHAGQALAGLSLADDAGHRYQMYWDGGSGTSTLWAGDVVALPEPPDDVAFFELSAAGSGAALRIVVPAPLPVRVGTADPLWPTAAESYLALLCAQDPPTAIGRSRGRHVVAAVAEALLFAGAIPAHSPLLPRALGRDKRSSHPVLPKTWPGPVRRDTQPDMRIAICAALPFTDAAVVIEGLSAWGENIQLHLYGWPWVHSERWPAAIPSFTVSAIDDLGGKHEGRPGTWRGYGEGEGHGDFTLWPAVPTRVNRLHVAVSTLWEAAWADIELPPGRARPG
ncbi:MAG TPA: hypothetical protein VGI66_04660 [Streptosporangiaceae bacterium]